MAFPLPACHSRKQNRWWIWRSWLARQIVALEAVGSTPTIHPISFGIRLEVSTPGLIPNIILGCSQVVRHQTLTLAFRWFESIQPNQQERHPYGCLSCWLAACGRGYPLALLAPYAAGDCGSLIHAPSLAGRKVRIPIFTCGCKKAFLFRQGEGMSFFIWKSMILWIQR